MTYSSTLLSLLAPNSFENSILISVIVSWTTPQLLQSSTCTSCSIMRPDAKPLAEPKQNSSQAICGLDFPFPRHGNTSDPAILPSLCLPKLWLNKCAVFKARTLMPCWKYSLTMSNQVSLIEGNAENLWLKNF
jgi:hypothetical protein